MHYKSLVLFGLFSMVWQVYAQQQKSFVIPANKAYAEPFELNHEEVGVRIPVGYPEDHGDVSHWTDQDRKVVWYLYQKPGSYQMRFEYSNKGKSTPFQLGITPCYEVLDYKPTTHMLDFNTGTEKALSASIPVSIKKTGYYRYELTALSTPPVDLRIHHLHFQTASLDGQVNQTDYQSSSSVHINFSTTATTDKRYNWLYEDVLVPAGSDPFHTFYMAIGFYRGYLGMQTNSDSERRVLFSVWDSKDAEKDKTIGHDDFVSLVDKGESTTVNSFGGEGTGGQSYVPTAGWKTGKRVSFIMNVLPQENNSVILSAWYKLEGQTDWNYIASWRAPKEQRYFDGFHSFLENYGFVNGQQRRMAEYYNAYGYEASSGRWVHLNKVRFSHTDGKEGQRVDYEQGVSPLHADRFYMSSGGYTPTVKTADTVPLQHTAPSVDLRSLEKRVKEALENESKHKDMIKKKSLK